MVNDVFKFPNGKGGFILKIMGEDGNWHLCDEAGKFIEEKNEPVVKQHIERLPKKTGKKALKQHDRKTSLYMSDELLKKLRHYCIENNTSMCAVINEMVSKFLSSKKL